MFGQIRGCMCHIPIYSENCSGKCKTSPEEVANFHIIVWLLSPLSAPLHRCCDNAVVVFWALGLSGSLETRWCRTFEWDKEKSPQGFPFKGFSFFSQFVSAWHKALCGVMHKIRLICATICLSTKVTYNNSEDWKIINALERLRLCYCTIYLQCSKC